jgi:hypothetical protein
MLNIDVLQQIVEGWKNLLWKDKEIEKIAIQRAAICASCEELSTIVGFYLHCKRCTCYIPAMTRSMEKRCPMAKWNDVDVKKIEYV